MYDSITEEEQLQDPIPKQKYKVSQQVLNDFSATIEAKPNLTQKELLSKFPEFKNDLNFLQSAFDYDATVKSGKYKTTEDVNSKFPEFDFGEDVKKKGSSNVAAKPLGNGLQGTQTDNNYSFDKIINPNGLLHPQDNTAFNPDLVPDMKNFQAKDNTMVNIHDVKGTDEQIQRHKEVKEQAKILTAKRSGRKIDDINKDITDGKLQLKDDGQGNKIYGRVPNAGETFIRGLSSSINSLSDAATIAYTKATGTPEELAYLYEMIAHRKKVESEKEFSLKDIFDNTSQFKDSLAPTTGLPTAEPSTLGSLTEMAGAFAPDVALSAGTGGLSTIARMGVIGSKMLASSYGNKAYELYDKGKQEAIDNGMDEKQASIFAAQAATENALPASVPEAALNTLFFLGKLHSPAANNFVSVIKGTIKDAAKVSGLGMTSSALTSGIEGMEGYNTDEWVNKMLHQGGDFAKMELMFKVLPIMKSFAKPVQSVIKEFAVDPVVKPFVENYIKTLPEVQQLDIMKDINEYEAATKNLRGVVSEEKMASLGGRMQKRVNRINDINLIKEEVKQLEEKKATLPEALHEEIDNSIKSKNEEIKSLQKEIGTVDKEINTINKSEGSGLEKEVDEATGEPIISNGQKVIGANETSEPVELKPYDTSKEGENGVVENDAKKLVEPFVGKGALMGMDADQSLKYIAEQAQGVSSTGEDVSATGNGMEGLTKQFGKNVVDAAIELHPKETLLKNNNEIKQPTNIPEEITKLEGERDAKIDGLEKPKIDYSKIELSDKEWGKLSAEKRNEYEKWETRRDKFKDLIECLWKQKN